MFGALILGAAIFGGSLAPLPAPSFGQVCFGEAPFAGWSGGTVATPAAPTEVNAPIFGTCYFGQWPFAGLDSTGTELAVDDSPTLGLNDGAAYPRRRPINARHLTSTEYRARQRLQVETAIMAFMLTQNH